MSNTRTLSRILVTLALAVVALVAGLFVGRLVPGRAFDGWTWEDVLTTVVGLWMLLCVPVSIARWVAVPAARYGGMLISPLVGMLVGGLSLVLPVLGQGIVDPALLFAGLVVLFAASALIQIHANRKSDELMRRFTSESTLIASTLLIAAFSLYAGGERLGVIPTVSPWGLVGIACLVQFAVAMCVYYRLGLDPGAQEKTAG